MSHRMSALLVSTLLVSPCTSFSFSRSPASRPQSARAPCLSACDTATADTAGYFGEEDDYEEQLKQRKAEYLANETPEQRRKRELATARKMVVTRSARDQRGRGFRSEQKAASSGKGFGAKGSGLKFDRRPKKKAACACGFGLPYGDCCSGYHDAGHCDDDDPAWLVRARYTAFCYRLPDFLMATTDPAGDEYQEDASEWKKSLLQFCDQMDFQKLTVEAADSAATPPTVDFRASFVQKGTLNLMDVCEKSEFARREDGKWLYTRGTVSYDTPK